MPETPVGTPEGTPEGLPEEVPVEARTIPWPLKVYGALLILSSIASVAYAASEGFLVANAASAGLELSALTAVTWVIFAVMCVAEVVNTVASVLLGWRLIRNRHRRAATICNVIIAMQVTSLLCDVMIVGFKLGLVIRYGIVLAIVVVLQGYVDPALAEERALNRRLREMQDRSDAEAGMLGRDTSGRGYITLNFFNLFWIFVLCCVIGVVIEVVFVLVKSGVLMNRTGLLIGQFSPIYGLGAVILTVLLNRFYNKNPFLIFLVSAVVGGAFEYAVSWFWEFAFGITAWDYSDTFCNIDGRTNLMYMVCWGLLGLVWIRLLQPRILALINRIPWNWRYSVTTVVAVFMFADCVMTLLAIDCWYQRVVGIAPTAPVEQFFAAHFNDAYMASHFETMSIDPGSSTQMQLGA